MADIDLADVWARSLDGLAELHVQPSQLAWLKLTRPLGLVENMSHFVCPKCHTESDIFGKGGGEALATEVNVPFLGRIPVYEPIRVGGDTGVPIVVGEPKSPAAQAFRAAAEQLAAQIAVLSVKTGPKSIPLTQVR